MQIMDELNDFEFQDVDITDKTILESQLNYTRKNYNECIKKYGMIQDEISKKEKVICEIKKKLYQNPEISNRDIPSLLNADDDYLEVFYEIEAYKRGEKIISEELAFIKSDLRILSNSMYNRF